jgi:hypothetical protein
MLVGAMPFMGHHFRGQGWTVSANRLKLCVLYGPGADGSRTSLQARSGVHLMQVQIRCMISAATAWVRLRVQMANRRVTYRWAPGL